MQRSHCQGGHRERTYSNALVSRYYQHVRNGPIPDIPWLTSRGGGNWNYPHLEVSDARTSFVDARVITEPVESPRMVGTVYHGRHEIDLKGATIHQ